MKTDIHSVLSGEHKWAVMEGDAFALLMTSLPADSIDLCFFSPPYVSQRLYRENGEDLGIARSTEEWAAWMREVVAACLRVCTGLTAFVVEGATHDYRYDCAPFLLMADLCRSGVTLRKPCVYRRSGIPGSGGPDWLKNNWEPIVCCTRGGKLPWSDNVAMGAPPKWKPGGAISHQTKDGRVRPRLGRGMTKGIPGSTKGGCLGRKMTVETADGEREMIYLPPDLANPGNVIDCVVGGGRMGHPLAHQNEAPFPLQLAEFFVRSFCPPGGVVLDPFCGSGTTLEAAVKHGRRALGFDLRPSQVALTERRLAGTTPGLFT